MNARMDEKVYIYIHDKYGNPGSFATTFEELQSECKEVEINGHEITLYESFVSDFRGIVGVIDVIIDQDGDIIAVLATPETVERYSPIDDARGLLLPITLAIEE